MDKQIWNVVNEVAIYTSMFTGFNLGPTRTGAYTMNTEDKNFTQFKAVCVHNRKNFK